MNPEKQRTIAQKGGRAAHEKGVAYEFSREKAQEAGERGGWLLVKIEHIWQRLVGKVRAVPYEVVSPQPMKQLLSLRHRTLLHHTQLTDRS